MAFSDWAGRKGEELGGYLSSLGNYRTEPYETPNLTKLDTWRFITPSPSDIVTTTTKGYMAYRAAQMMWAGSRSLGITSSLKRPFDYRRRLWHEDATAIKGFDTAGDFIRESTKPLGAASNKRALHKYNKEISKAKAGVSKTRTIKSPKGPAPKGWGWSSYYDDKIETLTTAEYDSARRAAVDAVPRPTMRNTSGDFFHNEGRRARLKNLETGTGVDERLFKPTLLERAILMPHKMEQTFDEISPGTVARAGGRDRFVSEFIKDLNKRDKALYSSSGKNLSQKIASTTAFHGRTKEQLLKRAMDYQKKAYITPAQIMVGEGSVTGAVGSLEARMSLIKEVIGINPKSGGILGADTRSFRFRFSKSLHDAVSINSYEATARHMQEKYSTVDAISRAKSRDLISTDVTKAIYGRLSMAKMLKVAGVATIGLELAGSIVKAGYNAYVETAARVTSTLHTMTRPDFGSGQVIQNSQMATERQRAMQAIGNAQMNARYLMGNEATYYH